jgi:hypothetical protein
LQLFHIFNVNSLLKTKETITMIKSVLKIAIKTLVIFYFVFFISQNSYSQCTVPTAAGVSNCGKGSVVLNASGNTGPYSWYDAATDGVFYTHDASFTTPYLNRTDTFYVGGNSTGTTNDALTFDGVNDYVAIQGKHYSDPGEINQITVEAWVKTTVSGANWYDNWAIIDFDRSEFYCFYVNGSTGVVGFATTDNGGALDDFDAVTAVNDGSWHHIAAVYDGTNKMIYVDGVLDSTDLNPHGGLPLGKGTNIRYGFIGDGSEASTYNGTRNGYYYQGDIDEVRVWNTARTASEISSNRNSCLSGPQTYLDMYYRMDGSGTTLTDYSGNGYNGTLYNMGTPWITTGPNLTNCPDCESTRTMVIATILPVPQPNLGNDTCVTDSLVLDAGAQFSGYLWNTGETTQTIKVGASGFYSVDVDSTGTTCTGTDGISISLLIEPDGIDTFRCGPGSLDLELRNANSNLDYYWYDAAVGGTTVGTGTTFTTPSLSSTTSYYVAEVDNNPTTDALALDGSDDYVAIQNMVYNGTSYTELTVEAWVKTTDGSDQIIASFDRSEYWRLEINGSGAGTGQVGFDIYTSAGILDFGSTTTVNDGNWHHIAAVYNNGTAQIYIDGVLDVSTTMGTSFGRGTTRYGFLGVGSEAPSFDGTKGPNNYFNGDIDEVRVWSVARNISQIQSYKDQCLSGAEAGLEAYYKMEDGSGSSTLSDHSNNSNNGTLMNMNTSTAWISTGQDIDCSCGESPRDTVVASIETVPSVNLGNDTCANAAFNLDAGSGFTSYLWQDGSTAQTLNANTSRLYWVEVTQAGTQCKGNDSIAVSIGTSIAPTATDSSRCGPGSIDLKATSPAIIHWWDQSSGGTLLGNGTTLTVGPLSSDSVFYMSSDDESTDALTFNGTSDYVAIQNKNYNTAGSISALTVEAWIKTSFTGGGSYDNWSIVDFDRSEYYNMWVDGATGYVSFSTMDNAGTQDDFAGTTAVNDNAWHHIAVVYDGTDKRIYVDGVLDATKTNPHSGNNLGSGVTRYGFIGDGSEATAFNGTRNNFYFEGDIDEVRIWNVARTATEINNNKSVCLVGNETGLELYYRMDEGSGSTLTDYAGSNNATLYSGTSWITTGQAFNCSTCASSGRKAVTATVFTDLTGITTNSSCPGDGGSEIYLEATGGSGSFDYRETNGVFGYSGSFQAGTTTKTVPNGGNYNIEAKDENGCIANITGLTTQAIPSNISSANGSNAGCIVPQKNDWFYIKDASSNAIVALNSANTSLGLVNANVYVDGNAGIYHGFAYMKRHFVVQTQNTPTASVKVRLYYTDAELTNLISAANSTADVNDDLSSASQLGATKYEGPTEDGTLDTTDATLMEFINQNLNSSQFGDKYIEISTSSFSEFWMHASALNSALPIELLSFNAKVMNKHVQLYWTTATETNNDFFTIQRSVDGVTFEDVLIVKGAGNSNSIINYSAIDKNPLSGISYYRLMQTDYDGTTSISNTIIVNRKNQNGDISLSIYPNPSTGAFNIILDGFNSFEDVELSMRNMTGAQVLNTKYKMNQDGNNKAEINLTSQLPSGIYILIARSNSMTITQRVIIR